MKKIIAKFFLVCTLILLVWNNANAQATVTLDTTFHIGTGASNIIETCAIQPDGKIIIGGNFVTFNGTASLYIARLNSDGTLDTAFHIGSGTNNHVLTTAIQSDGKIIIGGLFTTINGAASRYIARLNSNGTLDTTFHIGTGPSYAVKTIAIQPDGKIIIGGNFTSYNGTSINHIARLNGNGTLDNTFTTGTGANNIIQACTMQPDGKIIIGGLFTSYNGTITNYIARLNTNGTLDNNFIIGTGANGAIYTTAIQSDGKIIIGGDLTTYDGTTSNHIVRLDTNGILDTSFIIGTGANGSIMSSIIQADGKIIIGGQFWSYNGTAANFFARLNTNGNIDTTFTVGLGVNNVYTIAIQGDGKIIIVGDFWTYNGTTSNYIARLNGGGFTTGITELKINNDRLRIYPNPSNGSFVIQTNTTTKQNINVYDVNGKIVLSAIIRQAQGDSETTIDASKLNEGVYNVNITSSEGVANKRLVIVH